ncbi:hypothetical protein GCM10023329_04200 [Streptomyces sanyensis]|uniref:Uncharacterized protein n=1 Tax=Streptomyces sanyensis TaxID=568869 RepID=A0ABP8ZPM6_9ACTN
MGGLGGAGDERTEDGSGGGPGDQREGAQGAVVRHAGAAHSYRHARDGTVRDRAATEGVRSGSARPGDPRRGGKRPAPRTPAAAGGARSRETAWFTPVTGPRRA